MDIFNKKKVADLQSDLIMAQSLMNDYREKYEKLQNACLTLNDAMTEYLAARYVGKYFKTTPHKEDDFAFRIHKVKFMGGDIEMHIELTNHKTGTLHASLKDLSEFGRISKAEFMGKNNKEAKE